MKTTQKLQVGDKIIVKTGRKQLIKKSVQTVVGIYGNKILEVSFESGLVARFGCDKQHVVID